METNWMFYVTRINKLVKQIEDIRELHNPIWDKSWETYLCLECDRAYPCETALIVMRHDNDDDDRMVEEMGSQMCEHNKNEYAYCAYCKVGELKDILDKIEAMAQSMDQSHQHMYGTPCPIAADLFKLLEER